MPFPDIDPVLVQIGPLAIRWYSLAYIVGLLAGWRYCVHLTSLLDNRYVSGPTTRDIPMARDMDDFLLWATLGIILGGRLGYVFFYMPGYFMDHPGEILMLWRGGMSFHGGFLGVVLAALLFAHLRHIRLLTLADLLAAAAPIGLFLGRVANFINGELFGRPTDLPWGVVFPGGGPAPRHPSQLYEAVLEGMVLWAVLAFLIYRCKALMRPGLLTGVFFLGYGLSRFLVEFVRQPDSHIGLLIGGTTLGQWLSAPMIPLGIAFVFVALKRPATA